MKFRNLLMTAVFLLAVAASFSTKATQSGIQAFYKFNTFCAGGVTEQTSCSKNFTGPVCTIYNLNQHVPAYYYGAEALPCVALLHQM